MGRAQAPADLRLELRDGSVIIAHTVRRDGATLMATITTNGNAQGEVGYPIANIARAVFPEPPQLRSAAALLAQGKAAEAAAQLTPALNAAAQYYDVPGNYWKPLALLQLDALSGARRDRDVDALAAELGKFAANDPEVQRTLRIKQAGGSVRRGDYQKVFEALDPLVKDETLSPGAVAEAWLYLGAAHLARREFKPALLAYLHVPVYTPDRVLLMPPALLGTARAFIGLADKARAQTTLNDLIAAFPASPEATEAKAQLQKLADTPALQKLADTPAQPSNE